MLIRWENFLEWVAGSPPRCSTPTNGVRRRSACSSSAGFAFPVHDPVPHGLATVLFPVPEGREDVAAIANFLVVSYDRCAKECWGVALEGACIRLW